MVAWKPRGRRVFKRGSNNATASLAKTEESKNSESANYPYLCLSSFKEEIQVEIRMQQNKE